MENQNTMTMQAVNTQIQKAFNLKSVPFKQQNNYALVDSYGQFYFNILTLDSQSFEANSRPGTYYTFSLEMLEDKMCLSMELDREWVDSNGTTREEELMNYCEELPYTKEGIKEFKDQLKKFSAKSYGFSMKQISDILINRKTNI